MTPPPAAKPAKFQLEIAKIYWEYNSSANDLGVHVSLDLDACDPSIAPGVGTPVKGGVNYREAHLLMELIAESGAMVALDLVEINPTLDIRNTTAELGTELALSALGMKIL